MTGGRTRELVTDGVTEAMVGLTSPEVKEITGCENKETGREVCTNVTIAEVSLEVSSIRRGVEDGVGCRDSNNDDSEDVRNVNEGVSSMLENSLESDKGVESVSEAEEAKADSVKEGGSVELVVCTVTADDCTVNVSSGMVDSWKLGDSGGITGTEEMSMLDIAKLGVSSSEGDGEGIIANEDDSTRCSRLLLILTGVEGRREGEGITINENEGNEVIGVEDKDGNTGVGSSGVREEVVGVEGKDGSSRVGSSDVGEEVVGVDKGKDGNTGVGSSGVGEEVVGVVEGKDGNTGVGSSGVSEEVVGVVEGKDGNTGVGSSDVGEEVVGVVEGKDGSTGVGSSDLGEKVVGVVEGKDGSTGVGSSVATTDGDASSDVMT